MWSWDYWDIKDGNGTFDVMGILYQSNHLHEKKIVVKLYKQTIGKTIARNKNQYYLISSTRVPIATFVDESTSWGLISIKIGTKLAEEKSNMP